MVFFPFWLSIFVFTVKKTAAAVGVGGRGTVAGLIKWGCYRRLASLKD
jgi:hypothetical protein